MERNITDRQAGGIFRLTSSHRELTKDHVLTSPYVNIFRTVTRNAVNKGVWRKKDCSWLPLNKHAIIISKNRRSAVLWESERTQEQEKRFPTCSELTPHAPIPDGRMEQIMQPWSLSKCLPLSLTHSLTPWPLVDLMAVNDANSLTAV